jgi:isoleucyl-tRNA synthetase
VTSSGAVTCGGHELGPDEFTVETVLADGAGATAMLPGGGFIVLDTAVTPQLAAEGLARDVVRAVQQARRAAGLDVSDRISLVIAGSPAARESMRAHRQLIAIQTLATAVTFVGAADLDGDPLAGQPVPVGDGESVRIRLSESSAPARRCRRSGIRR